MDRIKMSRPDFSGAQDDAVQIIGLVMARAVGDAADRLQIFGLRYGTEGIRWLAAYLHHFITCVNATDQTVEELLSGGILPILLKRDKAKVRASVAAAREVRKLLDARDVDGFQTCWAQIANDGLGTVTIWALICAAATAVTTSTILDTATVPTYLAFPVPIYGHPN